MVEARQVKLERAWNWLEGGRRMLVRNPLILIAMVTIWVLVAVPLSMFGWSALFSIFLWPAFYAGFFNACNGRTEGGRVNLSSLFTPLFMRGVGGKLLFLCVLTLGLYAFLAMAAVTMVYGSQFAMASTPGLWDHLGGVIIVLAGLVSLVFFVLIQLLCVFAAPLILFHGLSPIVAMADSFNACSRNWQAFLVYGGVLAVILFGYGVLLLFLGWVAIGVLKARNPLAALGGTLTLMSRPEFIAIGAAVVLLLGIPLLTFILCTFVGGYEDLFVIPAGDKLRFNPDGSHPNNGSGPVISPELGAAKP